MSVSFSYFTVNDVAIIYYDTWNAFCKSCFLLSRERSCFAAKYVRVCWTVYIVFLLCGVSVAMHCCYCNFRSFGRLLYVIFFWGWGKYIFTGWRYFVATQKWLFGYINWVMPSSLIIGDIVVYPN